MSNNFIISNWHLIKNLMLRDILLRYRGTFLGLFWSILSPLFMLTIYTFVFSSILKAKWPRNADNDFDFAIILFCGLIVFNLFAEILNRSPTLILTNTNYVKKVIFPLEILPITILGSALFNFLISLSILVLFYVLYNGFLHWTLIFTPIIILPLLILLLGLSWFFASLGVYARDIGQIISLIVTALMFLSPIFFPLSILPENIQSVIYLNPMTLIIEELRKVILWGELPDWTSLFIYTISASLIAIGGFFFFTKTKKGFADVL